MAGKDDNNPTFISIFVEILDGTHGAAELHINVTLEEPTEIRVVRHDVASIDGM